jgi:glycosyltransferase involved in cell wall biosynthesis
MRLLFVSNLYPPHHLGGYEQLCYEIAARLTARGHDIAILTSTFGIGRETIEPGIYRRLQLESDVYYYHPRQVLRYRSTQAANRRAIQQTLEAVKPDAVMVWGMWNLSRQVPQQLEQARGVRLVYYLASAWPTEPSAHEAYWNSPANSTVGTLFKRILRGPIKAALRSEWRPYRLRYEHVMTCSQSVCNELKAAQVPVPDPRVVYHGIDPEPYMQAAQRAGSRETDRLKVVFVGSLFPHKGVHTAIAALGRLRQSDAALPVTLDILGKGHPDYEAQLHALVEQWQLRDMVTFHDPIPRSDLPDFLARFNTLVLPSIWEEPMALISEEALAAQLVLIAAWTGGTKELLVDGVNGLAFPAEDEEALAQQFRRLAQDRALRLRLAQAGRRTILERFTMAHTLDEFEDYLSAVGKID